MTAVAVVMIVAAIIALPHLLRLRRAEPLTASSLWAAGLGMRALSGLSIALWLTLFVPTTDVFAALTRWCWHAVLPLLSAHAALSGHNVVDAAIVLPGLALAVSAAWMLVGVWRVARSVRGLVRASAVGEGPGGSVIVGGADVMIAAAGLSRPRVIVSAGALAGLDDEELAAALEHERAHIDRRHRFLLVYAEACWALGRFVPGARRAVREFAFHLERDADRVALRRHDRLALASAIVKSAVSPARSPTAALTALTGGPDLGSRLDELVEPPSTRPARRWHLRLAAGLAVVGTLTLGSAIPAAVAAGLERPPAVVTHDCPD